jgi:hypothetical protein
MGVLLEKFHVFDVIMNIKYVYMVIAIVGIIIIMW